MHHRMFNTPVVKSCLRCIALCLLKIFGWKTSGSLPQNEKYIIIVAPHTSNWDLFFAILLAFALKVDGRYIAKRELFRGPFSFLMTWSGAIPVDRSSSHHIVGQMVSAFQEREKFVIALLLKGHVAERSTGNQDFIILRWMLMFPFCWLLLITRVKPVERVL